jgi:mono/diheme cytochrome c family protein
VFQPLTDGKPSGPYVIFADGFAGLHKDPGRAAHRPTGLAIGPDGALYIADDVAGRIWRITFVGDPAAGVEAAVAPAQKAEASPDVLPPEGVHSDAGESSAQLPVPPGSSSEQVARGEKIFSGEIADATCAGCHGANGIGTPVGPNLTTGTWLWSDGSLAALTTTIKDGVPEPKQHPGAMPPMGGITLSDEDLAAVASYVWAIGHKEKH